MAPLDPIDFPSDVVVVRTVTIVTGRVAIRAIMLTVGENFNETSYLV